MAGGQKNESVVSRLLGRLRGAEDNGIYDVLGNKVGDMVNGKLVVGGVPVTKQVVHDDEPEMA